MNKLIPQVPNTLTKLKGSINNLFNWIQFLALISIALTAVLCFVRELWMMTSNGVVHMGDLLLLFLYTEVIVMARTALQNDHEALIAMPLAIAVVALARYMIIGSSHEPLHQIMYATGILILVVAMVLWYFRTWPNQQKNN